MPPDQLPRAAAVRPRGYRPAESLLAGIVADSLDPSYAAAAGRRAASTPPRPGRRLIGALVFALAGLMLVLAAQQAEARRLPAAEAREGLSQQIANRTEELARGDEAVRALRAEVARRQQATLSEGAPGGGSLLDRLEALESPAGTTAVRGPGILLTVDDAPGTSDAGSLDPREQEEIDAGRVLDRDLQGVVNGLWAAGAEAITVDDHRLSSLSAIRAAGLAILVDYKYALPPYEIRAVGDPATLASAVEKGVAGQQLRDLRNDVGIVFTVEQLRQLTLAAAEPGALRWASATGASSATVSPSREGEE